MRASRSNHTPVCTGTGLRSSGIGHLEACRASRSTTARCSRRPPRCRSSVPQGCQGHHQHRCRLQRHRGRDRCPLDGTLKGQRRHRLPQLNAIPACTMIVLPSRCHLRHGHVQLSSQPLAARPIAQLPSARCCPSQLQLPLYLHLSSFATRAAVRPLARRSLFPHDSGSIPGRAVSTFLSEFFIRNGRVTRCALLCSNRCCC